jgi:hypothetical protein
MSWYGPLLPASAQGGGPVSVNLTGLAASGAVGAASLEVARWLTGVSAYGTAGFCVPAVSVTVVGTAASGAVDTTAPSYTFNANLVGLAARPTRDC